MPIKTPEVIVVTLSNGDVALFVNSDAVVQLLATETGHDPAEIGKSFADSIGVEMQEVSMDVPLDDEWSWNDVYELLPPMPEKAEKTDSVHAKCWDCYQYPNTPMTHQIDVTDQRASNGQIYLDVGALEGNLDDMLSVTMEVNTNPLNGVDHVPCAHVHFDGDAMAVSLFKIGNKILVRPEREVEISSFRADVNGIQETFYWIE